ncbi:MAG: hypothetical protein ABIG98_08785 [Chloroflexota bacterium]
MGRDEKSKLFEENWEKCRGDPCPRCGRETFRFVDGVCPACHRGKSLNDARAMEYISMALTYRVLPIRGRRPTSGGAGQPSP